MFDDWREQLEICADEEGAVPEPGEEEPEVFNEKLVGFLRVVKVSRKERSKEAAEQRNFGTTRCRCVRGI